jgi:putative tryptophan/tyrosine transport system substrate-binding protein
MERRALIATLAGGLLAAPLVAEAQQRENVPRIGFLMTVPFSPPSSPCVDALRQGLRELGRIEGQNIAIAYRTAENRVERLPDLAEELAALNVTLIVAASNAEIAAGKRARRGLIPIVSLSMYDPIGSDFIGSYAHPGGNITGLTSDVTPEMVAKRLDLLREVAPKTARVAILWSPAVRGTQAASKELRLAAEQLGMTLYPVVVRKPDEFDRAFADMKRERVDAVSVLSGGILLTHRERVIALAMRNRWPVFSYDAAYPAAGGLMSYGTSLRYLCHRAASYVDKILKGAKPADLPVEQPTSFDLVINLKTAKALGLTVPPSLLQRADQVIE